MLDTLTDKQPMICLAGKSWLAECASKPERVIDPLLRVLLDPNIVRIDHTYVAQFDTRRVIYHLHLIRDIINCEFTFIPSSPEKSISEEISILNEQQESHATQSKENSKLPYPIKSYFDLIVGTTLRFVEGYATLQIGDSEFVANVSIVQSTSANLLRYLLRKVDARISRNLAVLIQGNILKCLNKSVEQGNLVLQVELLRLLKVIVSMQYDQSYFQNSPPPIAVSSLSNAGSNSSTGSVSNAPIGQSNPNLSNNVNISDNSGNTSLNHPLSSPNSNSYMDKANPSGSMNSNNSSGASSSQSSYDPSSYINLYEFNLKTIPIGKSPLLVPTITSAFQQPLASNVRYYWLEFISSILPYLNGYLKRIVPPICLCLCEIIFQFDNVYAFQVSQELFAILDSMKLLLSVSFIRSANEINHLSQQPTSSGGVIDIFTTFLNKPLFAGDDQPNDKSDPIVETRTSIQKAFPEILKSIIKLWDQPTLGEDELANKFTIQDRIVKILDPIFMEFPHEVLYSLFCVVEIYRYESEHSEDIPKIILELFNAMDCVSPSSIFKHSSVILSSLLKTRHPTSTSTPKLSTTSPSSDELKPPLYVFFPFPPLSLSLSLSFSLPLSLSFSFSLSFSLLLPPLSSIFHLFQYRELSFFICKILFYISSTVFNISLAHVPLISFPHYLFIFIYIFIYLYIYLFIYLFIIL